MRPLINDDAVIIAGCGADEAFCRAAGWTVGLSHEAHVRFQERLIGHPPPDLVRLAVQADGELVGYLDLQGEEPVQA